jgi:type 1 fimbriae regulatory protein FimB/type 1 fimbriae regulatory protein FimE
MKSPRLKLLEITEMRPVAARGRQPNAAYRVREHLTEDEMARLLATLKRNRHGQRDWLIGLLIYRHGLRVSEACDLRWDDIDLPKRTIIVRRLKGSTDSSHYLERDEHKALGDLRRAYAAKDIKSDYVFVNERGEPFGRMGIARKIERAGEAAGLSFSVHVHMCGIQRAMPWPPREWTRGASSTTSAMPRSRTRYVTRRCHLSRSRTYGAARARGNRPQNAADASEHARPLLYARGGGHRCV